MGRRRDGKALTRTAVDAIVDQGGAVLKNGPGPGGSDEKWLMSNEGGVVADRNGVAEKRVRYGRVFTNLLLLSIPPSAPPMPNEKIGESGKLTR